MIFSENETIYNKKEKEMTNNERCELGEALCQHCFDEMFKRKETHKFLDKLFNDYYPNKKLDHNDLVVRNYSGGTFFCENKLRAGEYFYDNFKTATTLMETDKENGGTQVFINFYGTAYDGWKKFIIQFIPQIDISGCECKEINPRNSMSQNENKWRRFVPYDLGYIFEWDGNKYNLIHQPNKQHKLYREPTTLIEDTTYDSEVWKQNRNLRIKQLQDALDNNNKNIKLIN